MGATVKSTTISSSTVEQAELASGFRQGVVEKGCLSPQAPVPANWGAGAASSINGSKVTVTNTGAGGTTGATVTVAHGLGVAPRGVAVVPISQFNGVQAVVLPASISTTQFVISVAVAPSTGPGTWVFEVVVFP